MIKCRLTGVALLASLVMFSCNSSGGTKNASAGNMIVRLSEIEIDPAYLDEYKAILVEEAEASVRLEPGVISIYPMQIKQSLTQVKILEIYASEEAYKAHLQTPHFQKYKTTTLKMVKALRLVDMQSMDTTTMASIFRKINP